MNLKLSLFFLLLFTLNATSQNQSFYKTLDSIQKLRKLSNNEDISIKLRLDYAKKASELSYKTKQDTIKLKTLRTLAYLYPLDGDITSHRVTYHKILTLSKKLKDSLNIAKSLYNIGWNFQISKIENDSAFYYYNKALKMFKNLNMKVHEANILFNMAVLQGDEQDYNESETNLIKSLSISQTLPENNANIDLKISIYNLLGVINKKIGNYEVSLKYYQKSLSTNRKLPPLSFDENSGEIYDRNQNYIFAKINIAELYNEQKQFNKSIAIYNELLKDKSILTKDPITYATILSNLAYVKFKANHDDHKKITALFNRAYKISDSLGYKYETVASGNDLSEFYLSLNEKDLAIKYLKKSYSLSKAIKNNTETSRSLKLLSQAIHGEEGKKYLYEYIKLNDSLIEKERIMQNKFARIQFETDEVVAENIKITKDRSLLFIIASVFFVGSILIYIIYSQRLKNKQLVFESKQQKANEDIYSLMLSQQSKLEEGRINERQRISEELHDGVLGKLFGIRVGFEFLLMKIKADSDTKKKFNDYLENIQSTELEIREISHELRDELITSKIDFINIIDHYLKAQSDIHLFNYKLDLDTNITWDTVSDKLKVNLFRIIQEALQNTVKHAQATNIDVNFSIIRKKLVLIICDDGIGFNQKNIGKGIGLKNITSRVENLNGKLKIESNTSTSGTTITAKIPINKLVIKP